MASPNVVHLSTGTEWVQAPAGLQFEKLNPVQAAFLPHADQEKNVVVAAATSSGKTLIAQLAMTPVLQKPGSKAIYLAPLKALAQEKLEDWGSPSHPAFGQMKVVLATGDTMFGKERDRVLKSCREANILCLTSEMLDSLTRRFDSEKNSWLADVAIVIVDEAHLLTMEERGDKLESAIMRFSKQNPNAKLVFLSATMPNVKQIGAWASSLNGKDTVVIESDWRPVPLFVDYPTFEQSTGTGSYQLNKTRQVQKVVECVQVNRAKGHRVLVFVHAKNDGHAIQKELETLGEIVEFHNADVERMDRLRIERSFRDKSSDLGCIIATSTLAYGLNLPARVVVICGSHRGMDQVHPYDIRQEVGRAGRFGLDPQGDVFIVLGDNEIRTEKPRLENLPAISSQMEHPDVLLFHLVAEVAEGFHQTEGELWDWYRRTLASRQSPVNRSDFLRQIEILCNHGALAQQNGKLQATGIGRVSSWFYYHPLDVADWARNLRKIHHEHMEDSDVAVAWALARTHTQIRTPYIPKALQPAAEEFRSACWNVGRLPCGNESVTGYAYWQALTKTDKELPYGWGMEVRSLRRDSERVSQALQQLDTLTLRLGQTEFWKEVGLRIRYGVESDLVELVANLDGVGPERAKKLRSAGLGTLELISKAGPGPVGRVIGKTLATTAWAQASKRVRRGG